MVFLFEFQNIEVLWVIIKIPPMDTIKITVTRHPTIHPSLGNETTQSTWHAMLNGSVSFNLVFHCKQWLVAD